MSAYALVGLVMDRMEERNAVRAGIDIDNTGEVLGEHSAAREAGTVSSQKNESCPLSEDSQQVSLLPGLPDALTLERIVPKLSWRAFPILSSVSPAWQQVIQSRQAYQTRVSSNSTETLVVLNHHSWRRTPSGDAFIPSLALYSPREKSFHPLPHILGPTKNLPGRYERVSLDGKVYLLGGTAPRDELNHFVSSCVYVFDLVRPSGWKECARMLERRKDFGCAAKDGKLYVFGGTTDGESHSNGCEVYDPKLDSWSSVTPSVFSRSGQHVSIVGEEIFVHGGIVAPYGDNAQTGSDTVALFSEVYHPGTDEWRLVGPFGRGGGDRLFTAEGKLHMISRNGIHVHDSNTDGPDSDRKMNMDANHWTEINSFSWDESEVGECPDYHEVHTIHAVNGELLASVDRHFGPHGERDMEKIIFQSKGFGSENKELAWVKVDYSSLQLRFSGAIILCPVEL